ncbi:alginate lyase family protein [Spirosoma aerolatum]|uniref:alginate lyase family protein n=1 Tax=Spirosoma aerolatum TaxID=1211326 RepID=UPI0009AEDBE3|nr:alginate lyase family protein [Spirosoma aerolatum]
MTSINLPVLEALEPALPVHTVHRIGIIWRTIRHLSAGQIIHQIRHRLRGPARLTFSSRLCKGYFLHVPDADKPVLWQSGSFTFLNQSVSFLPWINWNFNQLGKLWTYHLNYFDFLNQPHISENGGLRMIRDFIAQILWLKDGLESYPMSIRIVNWIYFLSRHQIQDDTINRHLFAQAALLNRRLEYHLGGNHVIENGFALLTAGLYFRHTHWITKAERLLRKELSRQILPDGGHDERSPIYHQLLLNRLLDTLTVLQADTWYNNLGLRLFLTQIASQMLAWLNAVTFRNGDVPMVNDSAEDMAPSTPQLYAKAKTVLPGFVRQEAVLRESGYRMFRQSRYELIANVGAIGDAHRSGHAHADTFSCILYVDNKPVLIDAGTSTYEAGAQRCWERSTVAHNTVTINDRNSSEVWASFRVGRRARVSLQVDSATELSARHDGYKIINVLHQRTWALAPDRILITDSLLNIHTQTTIEQRGVARFHFHPAIALQLAGDTIQADSIKINVKSDTKPTYRVSTFSSAEGFNRLSPGQCLEISFTGRLETSFLLSG